MRRRTKLDFESDKSVIFVPTISDDAYYKTWIPWKRECETSHGTDKLNHLVMVSPSSPMEARRALETIAMMFKREFGYDFCQYEAGDPEAHPKDRAFFWTTHDYRYGDIDRKSIVGGCVFRWREWDKRAATYAMQWVWFHPHFRGAKRDSWERVEEPSLFEQAWPLFRKMFGDFCVEPPLSASMRAFLKKVGEELDKHFFLLP